MILKEKLHDDLLSAVWNYSYWNTQYELDPSKKNLLQLQRHVALLSNLVKVKNRQVSSKCGKVSQKTKIE